MTTALNTAKRGTGTNIDAVKTVKAKVSQAKTKAAPAPKCISEVLLIPLAHIEVRTQVRTEFNDESLQDLADDIRERGLRQPIEVNPIGDERYLLTLGERRFRAFGLLGERAIPALIVKTSDADRLVDQLAENIQREDLSLTDQVSAIRALHDKLGSSKAVAVLVKKSAPWVSKRLALSHPDLSPVARNAIENGITEDMELLGVVDQMAIYSSSQAWKLVDMIRRGDAGRETARQMLKEIKNPPADPDLERRRAEQKERTDNAIAKNATRMKDMQEGTGDAFIDWIVTRMEGAVTVIGADPQQYLNALRDDQRTALLDHFRAIQTAAPSWTALDWAQRLSYETDGHSTYLEQLAAALALQGTKVEDCYSFIDLAWHAHGGEVTK